MEVTLSLPINTLCDEVGRTTSYAGAKTETIDAYNRISAHSGDIDQLAVFAEECFNEVVSTLRRVVADKSTDNNTLTLSLDLSSAFDSQLAQCMQSLFSDMIVQGVLARWYELTKCPESTQHAQQSQNLLQQLAAYAFFKKKPLRPTYGN